MSGVSGSVGGQPVRSMHISVQKCYTFPDSPVSPVTVCKSLPVHSLLLLVALAMGSQAGYALDSETQPIQRVVSIQEVAEQIRQYKRWEILDARPAKLESGGKVMKFKLLNKQGRVIIIHIDPHKPSFVRLEE